MDSNTGRSSVKPISQGCKKDCVQLISKMAMTELRFSDFVAAWKQMKFHLIFRGREPDHEMSEFVRQLLAKVKLLLFTYTSYEMDKKVGALYLLYSLYYCQPSRQKIRLSISELDLMLKFVEEIKNQQLEDAVFVFYKLVVDNAFRFCATSNEHIFLNKQKISAFLKEDQIAYDIKYEVEDWAVDPSLVHELEQTFDMYKGKFPELFQQSINKNFVNDIMAQISKTSAPRQEVQEVITTRSRMTNNSTQRLTSEIHTKQRTRVRQQDPRKKAQKAEIRLKRLKMEPEVDPDNSQDQQSQDASSTTLMELANVVDENGRTIFSVPVQLNWFNDANEMEIEINELGTEINEEAMKLLLEEPGPSHQ